MGAGLAGVADYVDELQFLRVLLYGLENGISVEGDNERYRLRGIFECVLPDQVVAFVHRATQRDTRLLQRAYVTGDAHQDHRLLSELTGNTFRNHLILEYEIPKYDGDLGRPNVFVPLDAPLPEKKVDHLHEAFETQRTKRWFERETFFGLMRIRGMECNSPSGYAEAFHCRKIVL